ncbi:hypothetical protein GCM10027162_67830 [Streptomyces incanus]
MRASSVVQGAATHDTPEQQETRYLPTDVTTPNHQRQKPTDHHCRPGPTGADATGNQPGAAIYRRRAANEPAELIARSYWSTRVHKFVIIE